MFVQFLKDPDITIPYALLLGNVIPEKVHYSTHTVVHDQWFKRKSLLSSVGKEALGKAALPLPTSLLLLQ